MSQTAPSNPSDPSHTSTDATLGAAMDILAPLARWLLREGINYGTFTAAAKHVFVQVAREELARRGSRVTDSALSVMSGVHRKDLRAFAQQDRVERPASSPSVASQLVTRWLADPRYLEQTPAGPVSRALPRQGLAPSFESLAREVSSDVHPRTLLDELQRLGAVRLEGDHVHLDSQAFIPASGYVDMADLAASSVHDHLAAAVHNVTVGDPKFLEQSVFADGLSPQAASELGELARQLWAGAFRTMVHEATQRTARTDAPTDGGGHRMRFGAYYYHEPLSPAQSDDAHSPGSSDHDHTP